MAVEDAALRDEGLFVPWRFGNSSPHARYTSRHAARGVLVANTLTKTVIIPQNHGDKLHKQGRSGNSFAGKYLNSLQQNRSAIELPSKSNGDTVFHPRFSCLLLDTAGGEPRLLIIGRKI